MVLTSAQEEMFPTGMVAMPNTCLIRGARDYVLPKEDLEVSTGRFFAKVDRPVLSDVRVDFLIDDGAEIEPGDRIAVVEGALPSILAAERTALNLLTHMSGIATATRAWTDAVAGTGARVRDSRKTRPGLRALEKYAVRCGGGANHRAGLDRAVLLKDNHRSLLAAAGIPIKEAIRRARAELGEEVPIEVEVDTLAQLDEVLEAEPDVVLIDNMSVAQLRAAVRHISGRVRDEASGGITLDNVRAVAETGVDFISVGALTHSAPALDLPLELTG